MSIISCSEIICFHCLLIVIGFSQTDPIPLCAENISII